MKGSRVSVVGQALSDPNRAIILSALGSGRNHTAGELSRRVNLAASTTSKHLSVLVDAGLVLVEASGRHRYFRLASEEVAELLERIDALTLPETTEPKRPRPGSSLSFARSCYDHLAGELSVRLFAAMQSHSLLGDDGDRPTVTLRGHEHFASRGIDTKTLGSQRRPLTRTCLDWTERQQHLGGALGAAVLQRMLDDKWVRRGNDPRVIVVTQAGRTALRETYDMNLDAL